MAAEIIRCENCGRRNRVPAAATGTPRCGNCHKPLPWVVDADDDSFAEIAAAPRWRKLPPSWPDG